MQLLKFTLFFGFLFVLACGDTATKVKYIDAERGLRMRFTPNLEGERIATIPYNTPVIVIDEEDDIITISGKNGKWTKVTYNGTEGWVFGGFLSTSKLSEIITDRNYILNHLSTSGGKLHLSGDGIYLNNDDYLYLDPLDNTKTGNISSNIKFTHTWPNNTNFPGLKLTYSNCKKWGYNEWVHRNFPDELRGDTTIICNENYPDNTPSVDMSLIIKFKKLHNGIVYAEMITRASP